MQGGVSLTQNILKKGKPGPFLFLVPFNAFIKQSITGFFLPFQNKILPTAKVFVCWKDWEDLSECSLFLNYGFLIKFCAGDKIILIILFPGCVWEKAHHSHRRGSLEKESMKSRKKTRLYAQKPVCWLWMDAGNFPGATVGQSIPEPSTKGSASCELLSSVPWGQTLQSEVIFYKLGAAFLLMQRHFRSSLLWSKMLFYGSRAARTGQRDSALLPEGSADVLVDADPRSHFSSFLHCWHLILEPCSTHNCLSSV